MKKFIFPAVVLAALCLFSVSAGAQTQTYTVTNSSGMVITGVSISPNDANLYGLDLNTTGSLALDKSFEFTRPVDKSSCVYDVRYMGEDGKYYYVQDVDLCNSTTLTLPKPGDMKHDEMKHDEMKRDDMKK